MKTNHIHPVSKNSIRIASMVLAVSIAGFLLNPPVSSAQESAGNFPSSGTHLATNNQVKKQRLTNYEKGVTRLAENNAKEAIMYLNRASRENPESADVYDKLGQAYAKQKDYRKAIQQFDQAIANNKTNASYFYNRALARTYIDKIEMSISDCDQAIALDPAYAEAYLVRGISKALLGEGEGSMDDFKKAISLRSDYGEAYYNIGLNYYELRDDVNAKANFKKANDLGFNIPSLHAYLSN